MVEINASQFILEELLYIILVSLDLKIYGILVSFFSLSVRAREVSVNSLAVPLS